MIFTLMHANALTILLTREHVREQGRLFLSLDTPVSPSRKNPEALRGFRLAQLANTFAMQGRLFPSLDTTVSPSRKNPEALRGFRLAQLANTFARRFFGLLNALPPKSVHPASTNHCKLVLLTTLPTTKTGSNSLVAIWKSDSIDLLLSLK